MNACDEMMEEEEACIELELIQLVLNALVSRACARMRAGAGVHAGASMRAVTLLCVRA